MTANTAPWSQLEAAAAAALSQAYAPYSTFRVGSAAQTSDGRMISGCNVENAAYGVTLCAECSMIGQLFATGGGTLEYFLCFGQLAEGGIGTDHPVRALPTDPLRAPRSQPADQDRPWNRRHRRPFA
ncbi:cytidine deaminase [Glutamicibacter halophytocola]